MANVVINDEHLTAIGDAIRTKKSTTYKYKPREMADAILSIPGGGIELTEEDLTVTGNLYHRFAFNGWNWFAHDLLKKTTLARNTDITNVEAVCEDSTLLRAFSRTVDSNWSTSWSMAETIITTTNMRNMYKNCHSLVQDIGLAKSGGFHFISNTDTETYKNTYLNCYSLPHIEGIPCCENTLTVNNFIDTFKNCYSVSNLYFDKWTTYPYEALKLNWSNQTIDLSTVGFFPAIQGDEINYIDEDRLVYEIDTDAKYEIYNPSYDTQYYVRNPRYSYYTPTNAEETLRSLPDVTLGSSNTIKFNYTSMTNHAHRDSYIEESVIAEAADKGWTVSYV